MYDAVFQVQSKALYQKIFEVRGAFFRVCILKSQVVSSVVTGHNVLDQKLAANLEPTQKLLKTESSKK